MNSGSFNIFRFSGDILHVLSIIILWHKVQTTRNCAGLSLKSQMLFMAVYVARYLDLFYFAHFDIFHLYNFVMKCLFLGTQATILYSMMVRYRASYNAKVDTVRLEYLVVPCLVLAFFFMPSTSHHHHYSMILFIREVCF